MKECGTATIIVAPQYQRKPFSLHATNIISVTLTIFHVTLDVILDTSIIVISVTSTINDYASGEWTTSDEELEYLISDLTAISRKTLGTN